MYVMNRNFELGRARAADRLRRAERARVAAGAQASHAPDALIASLAICSANCEQAAAECDAA